MDSISSLENDQQVYKRNIFPVNSPELLGVLCPLLLLGDIPPECLDQDLIVTDGLDADSLIRGLGRVLLELCWKVETHPLGDLANLHTAAVVDILTMVGPITWVSTILFITGTVISIVCCSAFSPEMYL